jgi:hypothetical protein
MSGIRRRVSWIVNGRANTEAVLAALSADLRELQHKVDQIDRRISELAVAQEELGHRQLDGFDRVRDAMNDAVDDLSGRLAALREHVTP